MTSLIYRGNRKGACDCPGAEHWSVEEEESTPSLCGSQTYATPRSRHPNKLVCPLHSYKLLGLTGPENMVTSCDYSIIFSLKTPLLWKHVFPEFHEVLQRHSPHFINEEPDTQNN